MSFFVVCFFFSLTLPLLSRLQYIVNAFTMTSEQNCFSYFLYFGTMWSQKVRDPSHPFPEVRGLDSPPKVALLNVEKSLPLNLLISYCDSRHIPTCDIPIHFGN